MLEFPTHQVMKSSESNQIVGVIKEKLLKEINVTDLRTMTSKTSLSKRVMTHFRTRLTRLDVLGVLHKHGMLLEFCSESRI